MEVIIREDAVRAAQLVARVIAREIRAKPDLVLGLATGRTMEQVYRLLAGLHRETKLSFARVRTFNLDEYIGLPPDHPCSYRHYMNEYFFSKVDVLPENTYLPNGMAPDLNAECLAYERRMREWGGIDFQLLGIGSDGHIGFNEPLSALQSRTREKALTPSTLRSNAAMFGGDILKVPRRAITMGVGTILESRRCVMLVTGANKADIVAQAVEGPITAMVSASALQLHPHCTVVVDEAAASGLKGKEYYRWIFDNEPEWAEFR
jgi:glucosamine-6-phosphate deaminase